MDLRGRNSAIIWVKRSTPKARNRPCSRP